MTKTGFCVYGKKFGETEDRYRGTFRGKTAAMDAAEWAIRMRFESYDVRPEEGEASYDRMEGVL